MADIESALRRAVEVHGSIRAAASALDFSEDAAARVTRGEGVGSKNLRRLRKALSLPEDAPLRKKASDYGTTAPAVREGRPDYGRDPVALVVSDGQRELAQWAQGFAARLLRASASQVEAMPLPKEFADLPEAEVDEDARQATPHVAARGRPPQSVSG